MRDEFSIDTKDLLAKRAGVRCSNPDCRQPTSGPQQEDGAILNIGVAAHITAAAPNGPRYDPSMDTTERSSFHNGIWLCQNCAKLIDNDTNRYTPPVLRRWKQEAEALALQDIAEPSRGKSQTQGTPAVLIQGPNAITISGPNAVNLGPNAINIVQQQIARDQVNLSTPDNWITNHIAVHGCAAPVPEWLEPLLQEGHEGEPIHKGMKLRIAGPQDFLKLKFSQRRELMALVDWLGGYHDDYLQQMQQSWRGVKDSDKPPYETFAEWKRRMLGE